MRKFILTSTLLFLFAFSANSSAGFLDRVSNAIKKAPSKIINVVTKPINIVQKPIKIKHDELKKDLRKNSPHVSCAVTRNLRCPEPY